MPQKQGVPIQLATSINTDHHPQKTFRFGDTNAPQLAFQTGEEGPTHNKNTGIFREGGLVNLYLQEQALAANTRYHIADDGTIVGVDASGNVSLNSKTIGQVSPYGVQKRLKVSGYDDVKLTADQSYITIKLVGTQVTLSEFDLSNNLLHSRVITFANLASVASLFTSIGIVSYDSMHYADSQEFVLRLGPQVVILQESNPGITIQEFIQSSSVIGGNQVNAVIVYQNYLIVAGAGGRLGSFDGSNWKNYDGSGSGLGPYNNGVVVGTNDILTLAVLGSSLVIGGRGGRIGSFDGFSWHTYADSGTGLWNNATVVGTDDITALGSVLSNGVMYLLVGGSAGKIGSWNGTSWTIYSATGMANNATVIGAVSINAMVGYTGPNGVAAVLACGASGRIGYMVPGVGVGWLAGTLPNAYVIASVCYGNGKYVAISLTSSSGVISSDGINWSAITLPSITSPNWNCITFGNGVFVALLRLNNSAATNIVAYSSDGVTWNTATLPSTQTWATIAFGNGIFVAASELSTAGAISTNGSTWSSTTLPSAAEWSCSLYAGGQFIFLSGRASNSTVGAVSTNGTSWTSITVPSGRYLNGSLTYGNGVYVAVNFNSTTNSIYSSNGTSWSSAPISGMSYLASVTFIGCGFIAVDGGTSVATAVFSTNGIEWHTVGLSATQYWGQVIYNAAIGVVVALPGQGGAGSATSYSNIIGLNYAAYTGTSVPNSPTNNGTVVSTDTITSASTFGSAIAFTSSLGKVGSLSSAGAWTNYNAGSGLCNNGTAIGAVQIYDSIVFGSTLVVAGANGCYASWDGANWKNYDGSGTGTGVYGNGNVVGTNAITSLAIYAGVIMLGAVGGYAAFISSTNQTSKFYNASGTLLDNLLTGFAELSYLYACRYENGLYMINLVGNAEGKSYTLNSSTYAITILNASYVVPQRSGGKTRFICTTLAPTYDATNVYAIGLVGYTDFVNFSAAIVWAQTGITTANGIKNISSQPKAGFNYVDFVFTTSGSATDSQSFYAPQPIPNPLALFKYQKSNAYIVGSGNPVQINGYGKLNNAFSLPSSLPFEFRVVVANGVQAALSVAQVDGGSTDCLGVLITNFGELDPTWQPQVVGDNTVLYRYAGAMYIVQIGTSPQNLIQKLFPNEYKLNTISPMNVLDVAFQSLQLGGIDYHGQMFFSSAGLPAGQTNVASFISGKYANSIDMGDKITALAAASPSTFQAFGIRIPSIQSAANYEVATYVSDAYLFSTFSNGNQGVTNGNPYIVYGTYAPTTELPIAIGLSYSFFGRAFQTDRYAAFLDQDRDGYLLGNQLTSGAISTSGSFQFAIFVLFAQTYLFDGEYIWRVNFDLTNPSRPVFMNRSIVAMANGFFFLAVSEAAAYFGSTFDNGLYQFAGDWQIGKVRSFNGFPAIQGGVYNMHDDVLMLDVQTSWIWVRDQIVSATPKTADQLAETSTQLLDTAAGIAILGSSHLYKYSYEPLSGSMVVPLDWQSAYFGAKTQENSILYDFVTTIYDESKSQRTVTGTIWGYDDNNVLYQDSKIWTVNPTDYNAQGYVRLRGVPMKNTLIAASIEIVLNTRGVLVDCVPEFAITGPSQAPAKAGR